MTLPGAARTLRFAHRVDVKYDAGCLTPIGSVRFRLENAEISNKMFLVIAGQRLPVVGASLEASGSRGGWRIVGLLRGKATTFIFEKGANMVHGSRITSDPNAASGRAIPVRQGALPRFFGAGTSYRALTTTASRPAHRPVLRIAKAAARRLLV
jgi:hypothetical protein